MALVEEVIDLGFKAMIKCVEKNKVDPKLLGATLSRSLVGEIAASGADPCGENGEYHTFVYDGPTFSFPLPVEQGWVIDFGTHAAIDLRLLPDRKQKNRPQKYKRYLISIDRAAGR